MLPKKNRKSFINFLKKNKRIADEINKEIFKTNFKVITGPILGETASGFP